MAIFQQPTSYRLELPIKFNCRPVFHFSQLRRWNEEPKFGDRSAPMPMIHGEEKEDSPETMAVRAVKIGPHFSRKNGNYLLLVVRYQEKSPKSNSWKPFHSLRRLQVVKEFYQTRIWQQFRKSRAFLDLKKRFSSRVTQ